MKKKSSKFYRTYLILLITLLFFGSFLYDESQDMMISGYLYDQTPSDWTYFREFTFNLTGDHYYTFCMFVKGPKENPLYGRFRFSIDSEYNFEYTLESNGNYGKIFLPQSESGKLSPIYIAENQTIKIFGQSEFLQASGMQQRIYIYQDLPQIFLYKYLWVLPFVALLIAVWVVAYNKYERIFIDLKKYEEKITIQIENSKQSNQMALY